MIHYSRLTLNASVSLLILLSSFFTHSALAVHQNNILLKPANVTNRVIIKYKTSTVFNALNARPQAATDHITARTGMRLNHIRRMQSGAHIMQLSRFQTPSEMNNIISTLNADPDIEYAEPDLMLKPLAVPNDSRYNEQWQYFESTAGLNMPQAWDITQGSGAVVAVIDTGYRPHADLAENILAGYDMISDATVSQDGNGRDADATDMGDWSPAGACGAGSPSTTSSWHGTHVAGSVAAVGNNSFGVIGVAYKAKVLPVRVLGRCGGYTSDIADGIIWAAGGSVSGVPLNSNPANVINLSLGGAGSCGVTQQNAINTARNLGATIVVAAGNENTNASNANPANCNGVVTVAAVNRNGGRAYYSNYGSVVDVAAAGGDTRTGAANGILSTLNNGSTSPGQDSYGFYQGTSMATPHVAGVSALLYAVKPLITPDEVELILKNTSRAFPATCSQCGSGIVNAQAAVIEASGGAEPPAQSNALANNIPVSGLLGATASEQIFIIDVPAGAANLQFNISGGSGDADLYIKFASAPSTSSYDCRPYLNGNNETCTIVAPQTGTYHIMLRAYSSFSNVTLLASYDEPVVSASSINKTDLSGATGSWQHFTLDIASATAALDVIMNGGTGDADLYVRYGATPTTTSYSCRPYRAGNNETCNFTNPQAGTWYISIRAYSAYSGVSLTAGK